MPRTPTLRPTLVRLEDRHAPAVFTVTTTADNGSNTAPTPGSLREAILKANAAAGADDVAFAISGTGVQTIAPPAPLPPITDKLAVAGNTQPGFAGTPLVRLSGSAAGAGADGFVLLNHTGSTVRGLTVGGFAGAGVRVTGGGAHAITGNFLGTDAAGTTQDPNGFGVVVAGGAVNTTVGGTAPGSGNVISGNAQAGVLIADAGTAGTLVALNKIGRGANDGSVGNGGDGVLVRGGVGTAAAAAATVKVNTIAANKGNGVAVRDTSRFVRIEGNAITGNGQLGIAVDKTANDGLAPPTITAVTLGTIDIRMTGTLAGRPNTRYTVGLFINAAADAVGVAEGQTPIGSVEATTNATGTATFALDASRGTGRFVTATATAADAGDTSAFSNAVSTPGTTLATQQIAAGAGAGDAPRANVYRPDGTLAYGVTAFDATFTGGVRVALADFTGDGTPDLVVGTGPGAATRVRVLNGTDQKEVFSIAPFEPAFTGGVYVAAGDVTGDGTNDLVITPDEGGGPRVRVFNGKGFGLVTDFFGIEDPNFRGGARAAVGDVNGDRTGDLVVAAGFGGGPRIATFNGKSLGGTPVKLFNDYFAFEQTLRNGVFVTSEDINEDGLAEIIAGGGPGGGPRVTAFCGSCLLASGSLNRLTDFFGGNETSRGGIRVAVKNLDNDTIADIVVGSGAGAGSRVTAYLGKNLTRTGTPPATLDFDAFPGFAGGVFVG